ncbi:cytochrome P450 [Coprinellus micaceus]|uniref:Cytochrome P450 n=1 Tax=Coprinellus micaceus TaxID=71717 RepID=A0A4Y7T1D6_COPMI|nr:cytochrome P450 [Coprinellus micaceus]
MCQSSPNGGRRNTGAFGGGPCDLDISLPFEDAKANFSKGEKGAHHSIAASLISTLPESLSQRSEAEAVARNICALAYMAGAETSFGSALALIFALAHNPEVQANGQAELESVVGTERLPLLSDRPSLPYIHALVKELGRWYNAGPLGVPHSNTEDDEYDGYFLPKGTMFLPNIWAMMHDPEVFERPFDFMPERYLKDGKLDLTVPDGDLATFGFGRRVCPGRHFAKDTLFLFTASILATCQISRPRDAAGHFLVQTLELMNTTAAVPRPFKCHIEVVSLAGSARPPASVLWCSL